MRKAKVTPAELSRRMLRQIAKAGGRPSELRDAAFRRRILSIPRGRVATYGQVAAAAGYPLYHRAVARLLRTESAQVLPWQRVVGAGGEIKLRFEAAAEQRLRLEMEGVLFRGRRVDLSSYQHTFGSWDPEE
ncbi:MAG: MGMT family protein [Acidobacteriota bacterium]